MSGPARTRGAADEVRRQLHAAVASGEHAELGRLLGAHPGFADAQDDEGRPLLIHAIERGDAEAVRAILDAGASANAHSAAGSALELAAGRSDATMVELLIAHNARDLRVAFRVASERRARVIMEMLAYREPTLQLQMEFDADIPNQRLVNTELLTRRLLEPVLSVGPHVVHLSWDGVRNTYMETAPGKPDRAFTVEVQQRLRLLSGEVEMGQVDGMWYSAIASGPSGTPVDLGEDRYKVRYAYYASSGAYEHYSAVDITFDFKAAKLSVVDVPDSELT